MPSPAPLQVLQITDTHMYSDPHGEYDGIVTLASLGAVLNRVRAQALPADAIVMTGDLVNEETALAYAHLRRLLVGLPCPVYCLPGNHDDPALMRRCLHGDNVHVAGEACFDHWQLVFLDTSTPGSHRGRLTRPEAARLEARLAGHPDLHAFVFQHHPPVPIGSRWMDVIALANPDELFAVIDRYPTVRGLACGHIHQEFAARRGAVAIWGTPSTCVQFTPAADDYVQDCGRGPGFRRLELHADGTIETRVERVPPGTGRSGRGIAAGRSAIPER